MSLRDALLKAGAVDKKKLRQTERELKRQRRKAEGSKDKKKKLLAAERAEKQAAFEARQAERLAARKRHEGESARAAAELRVRHLVKAHAIQTRGGGGTRFFFPMLDGRSIGRLRVPWSVARGLRAGDYGIAALTSPFGDPEYLIVDRQAAEKVHASSASTLVFWNQEPGSAQDPADCFTDDLSGPPRPPR